MNIEQISYNIKFLREQKGWTQQHLAEKLIVSRPTVTKWENNQLIPDLLNLMKLSHLFHISIDYLTGNTAFHDDLVREFKHIYGSETADFDEEAIKLIEYLMKFPDFKQQIHRLDKLSIKKQLSIHKILVSIIDQYEKI